LADREAPGTAGPAAQLADLAEALEALLGASAKARGEAGAPWLPVVEPAWASGLVRLLTDGKARRGELVRLIPHLRSAIDRKGRKPALPGLEARVIALTASVP